ncbi:hypothetical protein C9374_007951 [Naegleria lovaniensis]|uniref:Uncharacterized protein n=1 Tax=Naegleria lovaniensis TaxID=51637 RepID=A0AA88GM80_NAELO|nr:uncharacterized protein C9374_007951 [Naegleria lovaniensis]KAG2378803.1 hypothetical protein C9374_007951 [Naegleria lovaniensis]
MALSEDAKTIIIGTCVFWGLCIFIMPFTILCGKQAGLIRTMTFLSALCCWSMWILVFLSQINPLKAPERAESEGCVVQ